MYSLKAKSRHLCHSHCKKDRCPGLKKDVPFVPSKRYIGIPNQACLCSIPMGISKNIPINECELCGEIRLWKPLPIKIRHKKFNIFAVNTTKPPENSRESIKTEVKYSDRPGFIATKLSNSLTEIKELYNKQTQNASQQSINSKKFFPAIQCENYCYCPCPYPKIPKL